MILSVCVKLKEIDEQGRNFHWPKPCGCPKCRSARLWGHGFVLAYFDGFSFGLWLRRYRCPDCNCIIRMKPEGYFPRTDPYDFRLPEPTSFQQQVGQAVVLLPAAPLAGRTETKNHGLFWNWNRFTYRFYPFDEHGPDTCQPGHLIRLSFRHRQTYRTVCSP